MTEPKPLTEEELEGVEKRYEDYLLSDRTCHCDLCTTPLRLLATIRVDRDRMKRLHDLVRYKRSELLTDNLITFDEYCELAKDHPAVERLETYDSLRQRITELEAENARLSAVIEEDQSFVALRTLQKLAGELCNAIDDCYYIHNDMDDDCDCRICKGRKALRAALPREGEDADS